MSLSLKAARVNANLRQTDVAIAMGVDRTTIGKWERNETAPSAPQFIKLCRLYHVTADDIFFPVAST